MVINNDELHVKLDIKDICPRRYSIWLLLFAMVMFGQWQLLSGVREIKKNYWDAIDKIEEKLDKRADFLQSRIESINNIQDLESMKQDTAVVNLNHKLINHSHSWFGNKVRFTDER